MPEGSIVTVTDATFAATVLAEKRTVVVDFWAEWCPSCRAISRSLAELAAEFAGEIVIAAINADENPETVRTYRVLSLPTLLVFRDGVVVHTVVGARPKGHLRRAFTGAGEPYVNR